MEEKTIKELVSDEESEVTEEHDLDFEDFLNEDEECYDEIAKTITEIAQPIKTTVRVGAEMDSKGKVKPVCNFTIERNLTESVDEFEIMADDFEALIERVKETMDNFKEE